METRKVKILIGKPYFKGHKKVLSFFLIHTLKNTLIENKKIKVQCTNGQYIDYKKYEKTDTEINIVGDLGEFTLSESNLVRLPHSDYNLILKSFGGESNIDFFELLNK